MSAIFAVDIMCDECAEWVRLDKTAAEARKMLREEGWSTRRRRQNGKYRTADFCSVCTAKLKKKINDPQST